MENQVKSSPVSVLPRPVRSCSEIAEKYYDANIKDTHSGKTQKLSSYLKRNGGFCAVGQLDLPSHMDWTQLRVCTNSNIIILV